MAEGGVHEKKGWKIVNDAIFGIIELKPHIVKIIDTVEFQRLRWIWQLGVAPFVYPTADHCRFEHSIGTYNLASKLVTKLQKQLKDDKAPIDQQIDEKDVNCVEIAALCHDIGHGPFSHVWDNTVLPDMFPNQKKVKHEDHFLPFWESKFEDDSFTNFMKSYGIEKEDGKLIAALINGKATEGKEILSTIVSNSESGMDVDKWDYLARDASYLGHSSTNYRIDIDRMIHLARAIKDTKDGKWKIAFRKSEGLNMLRVFQLRHYMHKTAYRHKTVIAIEEMMLDGLKRYFEKNEDLKKEIRTSKWILENDDSFVLNIMKSEMKSDERSEFQRILQRDLYTPIMEAVIYKKVDDPTDDIIKYLKEKGHKTSIDKINGKIVIDGFRFGFSKFKLGSTDNPLCSIFFYEDKHDKDSDKDCAIYKYTDETIPSYLKYSVDESSIIVFRVDGKGKEADNEKKILDDLTVFFKPKKELESEIDTTEDKDKSVDTKIHKKEIKWVATIIKK